MKRSDSPAGPVKRWADMTEAERAQVRATSKPPPPAAIEPFACTRVNTQGPPVEVVFERKLRTTEKAVLFKFTDLDHDQWVPKSVIEGLDEMDDGTGVVTLKRWFAAKAELING